MRLSLYPIVCAVDQTNLIVLQSPLHRVINNSWIDFHLCDLSPTKVKWSSISLSTLQIKKPKQGETTFDLKFI